MSALLGSLLFTPNNTECGLLKQYTIKSYKATKRANFSLRCAFKYTGSKLNCDTYINLFKSELSHSKIDSCQLLFKILIFQRGLNSQNKFFISSGGRKFRQATQCVQNVGIAREVLADFKHATYHIFKLQSCMLKCKAIAFNLRISFLCSVLDNNSKELTLCGFRHSGGER